MTPYQGPLETRARRWFAQAHNPGARAVRAALLFAPFGLAVLFSVPLCPSAALLHVPCPGCGMTRATLELLQGNFAAASALQPLALVVSPVLLGAGIYGLARYVMRGTVDPAKWRAELILLVCMIALTVVWALRWFGLFGGPVPV